MLGGVDSVQPVDEPVVLARELGRHLAALRRSLGVSQSEVARRAHVDRSYVSHAEHGRCVPDRQFWVRADGHLAAGGVLLAGYDRLVAARRVVRQRELDGLRARHHAAVTATQAGVGVGGDVCRFGGDPAGTTALLREIVEASEMDRRHFVLLAGGALTSFAHDWLFDPGTVTSSLAGRRIGHAEVDGLDQIADLRRKLHDTIGGSELLRPAREDLRLVLNLLDNATFSSEVGTRLYATAAEFARIAGCLAFDRGEHAVAQRFFVAGVRAAHLSGDRALGSNILVSLSEQANDLGSPRDAVRLAETALLGAKDLAPAVAARVHGHLAAAAGAAGDGATVDRAIGRMFELTAVSDPATAPAFLYWWSDARAQWLAGRAALLADQPHIAERHLGDAVSGLDANAYPLDRTRYLAVLARARLQLGEVDSACQTATEAATLTRELDSERLRVQLRDFRRTAQPHASSAAVRDFDARTADLLKVTAG